MAEFGEWRSYPAGTLRVSGAVDECRAQAKMDALRHGFDLPTVIFLPNASRDIQGMYKHDVVGWHATR